MTGFEPRTLVLEATALPTEPQPLPLYCTALVAGKSRIALV